MFYFISSSHFEDRIWFRCNDDYRAAMNYVAIVAHRTHTTVLAFVLMSNHVHFLVSSAGRELAKAFYNLFKTLYSKYFCRKYKERRFFRDNGVDIRAINRDGEGIETVTAYILMNPVAANICYNAALYPWGSGRCFFSETTPSGRRVAELSKRERIRLFHSKLDVNDDWLVAEEGYILPETYVAVKFVESVYRTARRLNYFLQSSSKARAKIEGVETALPTFRDPSLLAFAEDFCTSIFRKQHLQDLDDKHLALLIYELRRRSGADVGQISRVLSVSPETVAAILSSY